MDTPTDSVSEVKYLGIKIDETLSGVGILETTIKKCTGRIKFLYRQAGCLPMAVKKTPCQVLVQCHLKGYQKSFAVFLFSHLTPPLFLKLMYAGGQKAVEGW